MYAWAPFLMRQYPVDAAGHAQVGLGKVITGVEFQRCCDAALDEQRFHRACVVEYMPHHAVGRLGFLFCRVTDRRLAGCRQKGPCWRDRQSRETIATPMRSRRGQRHRFARATKAKRGPPASSQQCRARWADEEATTRPGGLSDPAAHREKRQPVRQKARHRAQFRRIPKGSARDSNRARQWRRG